MQIRDAVQADFEQITAIYNEVLTHSTAIYNDRPATVEERISWWRSRIAQGFPVLVAADGLQWPDLQPLLIFVLGLVIASPSKAPFTSIPIRADKASEPVC